MPFDSRSPFDMAQGDLELVERSGHPEQRRGVGRLAGLVVLAAVIAFCVAQDRETSAGVGRYLAAQRAAPAAGRAGRGPQVTIDEVMGPANRAAFREGLRWSGRVTMAGLIGALVLRRVRLKAETTRSRRG